MNQKKTNKGKIAVDEWKVHNPFLRASPKLIKEVNKELLKTKRLKVKPALF